MEYRHIPTQIEIWDYISSRFGLSLKEGPVTSRFMWRLFYHGCGIKGAQECTFLVGDDNLGWLLFEVKTHLDAMNPITKEFEPRNDRYAVAIWNQRPFTYKKKEFQDVTDVPDDHRIRLIIDLLDDDPTLRENEFVIDASTLSAIIEAEPSNDPSLFFFEGSVAWMAKQKEKADTGSGVGFAEFANTQLRFLIKDRFGKDFSVSGFALDAEHAEIRVWIPYDETLPCPDDKGHLRLEPSFSFVVPAYGGTITPYINLRYWREDDDDNIKNWIIGKDFPRVQEYGKDRLKGAPGVSIVEPDVDDLSSPIGSLEPYEYQPDDVDGFMLKIGEWVSILLGAFF